jgi:hypothetical protein
MFRKGAMLDTPRDRQELTLIHKNFAISEPHHKGSAMDQEHLVFEFVAVPNELALEFD